MKTIGTISRGIKAPIIKKGDDLVSIVVDSVLAASEEGKFELQDRDVVAMTEAIVGRAQGNYATLAQISKDVRTKTGGGTVGLIFPIMSRNRFSMLLKGIAGGVDKLIIQLSYPGDEVGNPLIPMDIIDEKGVNPYTDTFTEEEYYATFGKILHPFTGLDYIELYKSMGGEGCEIILANNPKEILKYTDVVINADIHTRNRTKRILKEAGAKKVFNLADFMTESVDGSGYNENYGLYGSNLATDDSVKLFPRDGQPLVDAIQKKLYEKTGKNVEVMIYGDGAFKDPVGGIWELADPVVSPAHTKGLIGQPNELKLKYLADNEIGDLSGEAAKEAMKDLIKKKKANLVADMSSQGTTPRRLTDLLGSLCDLTSGSGDKGTPIILIQNYFTNYASD
ncbi:MAG: F420-0--gamma-glutamyl ligase [Clostridia bacterium]|jgi:F420-0:gamma-glutamyl ligase|nr:F420-0--gamma-glutamyl ligase [Clostridia bacterium]MCX4367345.1 coenzyme F420-0:L-glutamate ligase [Clostridia bacterium]